MIRVSKPQTLRNSTTAVERRLLISVRILEQTSKNRHPYDRSLLSAAIPRNYSRQLEGRRRFACVRTSESSGQILRGVHFLAASSPSFFRNISTMRSEEHTSELQSLRHLVCRLLLEKKK